MSEMAPISPHRVRGSKAKLGLSAFSAGFGLIPNFARSLTANGMSLIAASTLADVVNSMPERLALCFRPPEEART
jgi:hypothetical protein